VAAGTHDLQDSVSVGRVGAVQGAVSLSHRRKLNDARLTLSHWKGGACKFVTF
jgi:hypothetical protein